MKKILFTLTLSLLTIISFAQAPSFTLSEEKPTFPNQFVAIEVDELTIPDGYNRALEWINITYNTPSEVIKSQLENKYIRIEGIVKNKFAGASNVKYQIEFEFKNNKVKFEVTGLKFYIEPKEYGANMKIMLNEEGTDGWYNLEFINTKMYKKNGKPKKAYAKRAREVMAYFNELVLSMDTYLKNPIEETESGDDDW